MSNNRTNADFGNRLRRLLSGILCLALVLGLLPGMRLSAQAAAAQQSWAMPYAEQLVEWGVMRGDINGNLNLGNAITRAEFVTFINRAYGYTKLGGTPFTDVSPRAWYADDIDIAYNVGYFKGTSPTTASPMSPVTREQAGVLLSRNLMLQETVGETLGFSDSRTLSDWSRGLIGAAAAKGVINGYADGSFRPQQNITRGEVAAMLVRSIGTPINKAGDYNLGSVYGSVTINTSGVKLRNSVITGNLYLTGGVDLGDVLLENVNVLGQIIVSGAGESSSSQSSVVLRNVEADEMIVDSIGSQFVTIRAEGNTSIGATRVRTNAYVDDSSITGYGLSYIELDGESGSLLQLAGSVKEVVNLTPASSLQIVQGSALKVTVDEDAVGSNVLVDTNTRVDELNLDVATSVTGDGDIKKLNVGAAGSDVAMLPDDIYVRPGITSNIAGTTMNNSTAAESSADPKLEAGYPKVKNIAPNSATMVFSTNKAGTVYWAVSAVADGSVSEANLIEPPAYGGNIFKSGTINAAASKTEYTAQVSGLTTDGSYYVSAVLVDSRGNRSPLKVTAFTTPDNTIPAFATGYPVMSMNTTKNAQVTIMTNKSCQLYYALLPAGSTAPKAAEFKASAITGNLGYGMVDVVKNVVTQSINVNDQPLEELTKYDLYLWLTDYDGAKSSAVRKLTFTTPDETPPVITGLSQNLSRTTATAIGVNYTLNEPGKLHWVIYADDATNAFATAYGRDENDKDKDGASRWKGTTVEARAFVKAGLSCVKKGTSSASKADTDIAFAISGLNSKTTNTTSYMLYVVAEDAAGNLSASVMALNVRTLDTVAPKVKQEFTRVDADNPSEPEVNTDIRLVFDESVQGNPKKEEKFRELYSKVQQAVNSGDTAGETSARNALADALQNHITMYRIGPEGEEEEAPVRSADNPTPTDWVVDYRYATVGMENGNMVITLPTTEDKTGDKAGPSALKLKSGTTYRFELEDIWDEALTENKLNKENGGGPLTLPEFTVVFAHVTVTDSTSISIKRLAGQTTDLAEPIPIDFNFVVRPGAMSSVAEDLMWDMLIWVDRSMKYDLYSRPARTAGTVDDGLDWVLEGSASVDVYGSEDGFLYNSLRKTFQCAGPEVTFKYLNVMDQAVANTSAGVKNDPGHGNREYAIHITELGPSYGDTEGMNVRVSVVTGHYTGLKNVTEGNRLSQLETAKRNNGVATIGRPDPWTDAILDPYPPKFSDGYPIISNVTDSKATITLAMGQSGKVHYAVVPIDVTETAAGYDSTAAKKGQEDKVTNYNPTEVATTAYGLGKSWVTAAGTVSTTGTRVTPLAGKPSLAAVPTEGPTASKNDNGAITNDNRYYLSGPEPDYVASMAEVNDTGRDGTIRSGTINLSANRANGVTLTNLKSDTIYLVYLVTENSSGYREAHAECYRFTTEVVRPPKLELSGIDNPTINAYVEEGTTADMWWYLVSEYSILSDPNSPFNITFSTIADLGTNLSNVNAADKDKVVTGMTALEAMNTRCYRTTAQGTTFAGTLFDLYVKKENTAQFSAAILANVGGGDIMGGSGTTAVTVTSQAAGGKKIECGKLPDFASGTDYVFVAMAARPGEGSNYSFAVYDPVNKTDREPPKITAAYITEHFDKDGNNISWGSGGSTGETARLQVATLTLNFDKGLYKYNSDSLKPTPIDSCAANVHAATMTSPVAIGTIGGNANTISVSGDTNHAAATNPTTYIELTIKNLTPGSGHTLIVDQKHRIVDEKGNHQGREQGSLIINVKLVDEGANGNHNWVVKLTINGRSNGDSDWTKGTWNLT